MGFAELEKSKALQAKCSMKEGNPNTQTHLGRYVGHPVDVEIRKTAKEQSLFDAPHQFGALKHAQCVYVLRLLWYKEQIFAPNSF